MKQEKTSLESLRHSTSHLLAAAVLNLFPDTKFAIGPAIEDGFYYDFEFSKPLVEEDLKTIEKEMIRIKNQKLEIKKLDSLGIKEALEIFKKQPYKQELIKDLEEAGEKEVSVYELGDFVDLCKGPHIDNTEKIGAFKLMSLAGAYWRGSEKNKMLTRVYGTVFPTKDELHAYLQLIEEAKKRDHRKLGDSLDLFVISELVGSGLPLYTFKGATVLREIRKYSNELQSSIGYQEVQTPNMNRGELFKVSGHYDKYKDDMFSVCSHHTKEEYFLKPMNCPQHTQIYASRLRSYKDLPIRIADFAQLYRDEKTGELSGLTRLRGFCQDDGHSFCREDQIKDEFKSVLSIIEKAMTTYGMNYKIRLSLWDPKEPEKYLGEPKVWEKSQKLLEEILIENKIEYTIGVGEAAIYGPKMDLISKDSLGREWQLSTIQLDFIMPQRFKLEYTDIDGKEKTPVMVHRAIVGSPERFFGILIEHYAGSFPLWLSPIQVKILSVNEKFIEYAQNVKTELEKEGMRVELDGKDDSLGKKIRNAEMEKVPYMLVIGEKEKESGEVTVRSKKDGDLGSMKLKDFIEKSVEEIKERR